MDLTTTTTITVSGTMLIAVIFSFVCMCVALLKGKYTAFLAIGMLFIASMIIYAFSVFNFSIVIKETTPLFDVVEDVSECLI